MHCRACSQHSTRKEDYPHATTHTLLTSLRTPVSTPRTSAGTSAWFHFSNTSPLTNSAARPALSFSKLLFN